MSKTKKTVELVAPKGMKAKEVAKSDAAVVSAAAKFVETSSTDLKLGAASPSTKKPKSASPIAVRASGGKLAASKAKPATAPETSKAAGSQTAHVEPKPSKLVAGNAAQAEAAKVTTPSLPAASAKPKTTKQEQVLTMLSQKGGTTIDEVMKATGWQKHSVRGFFAGTVRKKLGFELTSELGDGEERRYAIKVAA